MSRWVAVRVGTRGPSWRVDRKAMLVVAVGGLLAVAASIVNLGVGPYVLNPSDVVKALVGESGGNSFVVRELRLPRNLVAFEVGMAMAISGALLQGLTRNPLAAPELLGVSAGANLGAVVAVVVLTQAPVGLVPVAAFAGGLLATVVVYLLSWKGGISPVRLVVIGVGVAAVAQALVTTIVLAAQIFHASQAVAWMAGSLYGRGWAHLSPLTVALGFLVPAAFVLGHRLDVLGLGDDVARGLGSRVERDRLTLLLVAVALAAVAVATAGPIGFVGLVAPHAARLMTGPSHRNLVLAAGVLGGVVVVISDVIGRTLFAPVEVPAGLVTAAVGVPYFLVVLKGQALPERSG